MAAMAPPPPSVVERLSIAVPTRYLNRHALPELDRKLGVVAEHTRQHAQQLAGGAAPPLLEYTAPVVSPLNFRLVPNAAAIARHRCSDGTAAHWAPLTATVVTEGRGGAAPPSVPLPLHGGEAAAVRVLTSVAQALVSLHSSGVVHGLVCADSVVVDASAFAPPTSDDGLVPAPPGAIAASPRSDGTLRHAALLARWPLHPTLYALRSPQQRRAWKLAAPEVCEGEPFGPAADVWGLGVLLAQLLNGANCNGKAPVAPGVAGATAATSAGASGRPLLPSERRKLRAAAGDDEDGEESREAKTARRRAEVEADDAGLHTDDLEDCGLDSPFLGHLSPAAAGFIITALRRDPARRPTLLDCLKSPLLQQVAGQRFDAPRSARRPGSAAKRPGSAATGSRGTPTPPTTPPVALVPDSDLPSAAETRRLDLMTAVRARRREAQDLARQKESAGLVGTHNDPADDDDGSTSTGEEEEEDEEEEEEDEESEGDDDDA